MGYLTLTFAWAIFYISHTALASLNIKRKIKGVMGNAYKWYRLVYTLFSSLFFLGIFLYAAMLNPNFILKQTDLLTYLGYMLATFGTIISVKAFKRVRISQFLGLKPQDDLTKSEPFISQGLYANVRHPLYSGLILIFVGYFFFQPNWVALVHLASLLVYLPFGIYYEEKKLMEIYPEAYPAYQRDVPALIPNFRKFK